MDKEKIVFLHAVLSSLVFVYGPISEDDIVDHAEYYFSEQLKQEDEDLFFMVLDAMQENGELIFENGMYSIIPQSQYDPIYAMEDMEPYLNLPRYKIFEDAEELLKFESFETMRYFPEIKELDDYIDNMKLSAIRKEQLKYDCYGMALMVADMSQLPGIDKFSSKDREELKARIDAVIGFLPRGFFNGYSFNEIGKIASSENFTIFRQMDEEMLEIPEHPVRYGHFSYSDCRKLAEQLRETDIFQHFNSDNVIELYLNDQEVFVQLLGYYNEDYNLLIYRDDETMLRNNHFMNANPDDYPDLAFLTQYLMVALNDSSSFMDPRVANRLFEMEEPDLPLCASLRRGGDISLPSERELDLIGAVISYLLTAYEKLDKTDSFFLDSDIDHIYQLYLDENGQVTYTRYEDPFLGMVLPPVQIRQARKKFEYASSDISYNIGIFALPKVIDSEPLYLLIIHDRDSDAIVDMMPIGENDLGNVGNYIIDIMNDHEIGPGQFLAVNPFTLDILQQTFGDYSVLDIMWDNDGSLPWIYRDFVFQDQMEEQSDQPDLIS